MVSPLSSEGELVHRILGTECKSARPAQDWIVSDERAGADERLKVYTRMFAARLDSVLADDYPRLRKAVGDDMWWSLSRAYAQAHPPQTPSLRDYGRSFEDFLKAQLEDAARPSELPRWAPDLARFEWEWVEIFDEVDETPLVRENLMSVSGDDWPRLRFRLLRAHRVLNFGFPVHQIDGAEVQPEPSLTTLVMWRKKNLRVFYRPLSTPEAQLLMALDKGDAFGDCCALFASYLPDEETAPQHVVQLLGQWLDDGLIAGLELSS